MSGGDGAGTGGYGAGTDGNGDDASVDNANADDADHPTNDGHRFDRLPETAAEREVPGRATREEVLDWFDGRFAISRAVFAKHSFWEKGKGKIWVLAGDHRSPITVEGLGMTILRTRQEHWKPTTDGVQRFGRHAERNVIDLDEERARRFLRGESQAVEWDGDWGYLIVAHELAGDREPIGVGLYLDGELRSTIPKGRRRTL